MTIATKNLKNALIKENMREHRNTVEEEEERKKKEYGKVIFVEQPRQREDQIRRVEQRRRKENMEKRRQNSEKIKKFYAPKDEETAADSEDEEDEVLDFAKQKSEVIFWNDPRIGMTKKDIHLSTLVRSKQFNLMTSLVFQARSMGIMTITVEDAEEEQMVREDHIQLKGDDYCANGPLDRFMTHHTSSEQGPS